MLYGNSDAGIIRYCGSVSVDQVCTKTGQVMDDLRESQIQSENGEMKSIEPFRQQDRDTTHHSLKRLQQNHPQALWQEYDNDDDLMEYTDLDIDEFVYRTTSFGMNLAKHIP